jgi:putative transposase
MLRKRIREIAESRVRYGYRRVHVMLRREGWEINRKRVYRLYRLEGLALKRKMPRRRIKAPPRSDRTTPTAPNEVWAMDFMQDQTFDGSKLRVLTIVDAATRVSPAIDVRPTYRGIDVVTTLERVTAIYGLPKRIRVDQGTEFTSKDMDLWAWKNGVILDFSRPGKPTDNAFAEAFNSRVRAELLNANWFLSLSEARAKCEAWRQEYNELRPHGSIGDRTTERPWSKRKRWAGSLRPAAKRPRILRPGRWQFGVQSKGEPTDAFKTDMRTWGKVDTQLSRLSCQPGLRHDARRLSARHEVRRCLSKEEPQERRCNC